MKMSDRELKMIPFTEKFQLVYEFKKDMRIILNDLRVYAIKNDVFQDAVDFEISSDADGHRYLTPKYNPYKCDYFYLSGYRTAMCKTLTIEADDYIDVMKSDGKFTFTIEDKPVKLTFKNV